MGNNGCLTGSKPMKFHRAASLASACAALAACGGGGSDAVSSSPPAGATSYAQVAPTVGSLDTFANVTVDEAGNTIARTYEERVTRSASDGSYQLAQDDPNAQVLTVNGVTYRYDPTLRDFGGKSSNYAQVKSVATLPDGSPSTCTWATTSGGHPRPFFVGQTWTTSYTVSCPGTVTAYVATGSVDAVESITVAAGTFTALRLHVATSWSTAGGEDVVEQVQAWVDPAHSFFTLKNITTYQRTGTVPAHHVASMTTELQRRQ